MSDGTILNPGSGGDTILNEDLGTAKIPVSKIHTGAHGTDGGAVTIGNPLPVTSGWAIAASGVLIPVDSLAKTYTYSGGNVATAMVTYNAITYTRTYTYTGGNLTGSSQWT